MNMEEHNSPWIRLQDCQHRINFSCKFDIIWTERFTVIYQRVCNSWGRPEFVLMTIPGAGCYTYSQIMFLDTPAAWL